MRFTLIALVLSGCLVVEQSGDPIHAELGLLYQCTWTHNGVHREDLVCGPGYMDPAYVVDHLDSDLERAAQCTVTPQVCLWVIDPEDEP